MTEKLKVIKVVAHIADTHHFSDMDINKSSRQIEVLLPVEAILYLTEKVKGMPQSGYDVHVKKSYFTELSYPIKEFSSHLATESVEVQK